MRQGLGLDITCACTKKRTGIAWYGMRLVEALVARGEQPVLFTKLSRWRRRALRFRHPDLPQRWYRWYHGDWWPIRKGVKVIHGLDGMVPAWRGVVRVATVHDVAPLLFPHDWYSPAAFREQKRTTYARLTEIADALLVPSEATRADFCRLFSCPTERVHVVPHGIDPVWQPHDASAALAPFGLAPGYLLYVGSLSARKNLPRMIAAYGASGLAGEVPFVLAGGESYSTPLVREAIARAGVGASVRMLGYVSDDQLVELMAGAGALAYATLYEGFGFPILQAMASRVPVVAGAHGSSPEVAGGHAHLVDPEDTAAIAAAYRVALALPEDARVAAQAHAAAFTWAACAEKTCAVYEKVMS